VAENAFAIWNDQMNRLQVAWTVAPPGTPAQEHDGITSIEFSNTIYGDHFGNSTLAVTLVDSNGSEMTEADVIFNNKYRFDSYREAHPPPNIVGLFDLHRIAIHEFGHVLGLDHPDEANPPQHVDAIMNSRVGDFDNLQADDIAGIHFLYGTPAIPPSETGHLANISTRMQVGTGDNVMIGGFILTGTRSKEVMIRALGPSTHLAGTLANPTLELHDRAGAIIASNDDWRSSQEQEIINSGIPPGNNNEAALIATLPANGNSYTAIVRGVNNTTGVALLEIYDLDPPGASNSELANISTRGRVGTGNNVLIGGFIVAGAQVRNTVVRAVGPSTGVAGALADPMLELRNGNGDLLVSNDNYYYDYNIVANHLAPTNSLESALWDLLAPGNYTAIVRGVGDTTGVALVEAYAVP
jgi:hypothetical protein